MSGESTPTLKAVPRPHWGYQTSLFQWHQPAFWLFALLLLGAGILTLIEQSAFLSYTPGGFVLSWFLLALYAVPLAWLIYGLDLYEREPLSLVIGAFLWGAVAATSLSALGNTGWALVILNLFGPEFTNKWVAALTAPWVEELMKGVGVVLIYLIARREIDDVMDGFVYGAMVGLGFTVVEDVFYFIGVFGGETTGILTGFYLRVIASGLYGHVLYTGLVGMGIAYFVRHRHDKTMGQRFGVGAGLAALAVFAHFLWNSPLLDFFPDMPWTAGDWLLIPLATAVKGVPLLVVVVLMVRLAHRREHRWLESALHGEVGRGGLTAEELEVLKDPGARKRARREMRARGGTAAMATLKRMHREQMNLAMVATRVPDAEHPDLVRQRELCASLRERLPKAATPGAPPARP